MDAAGLSLWSRCATRILLRVADVPAASLQQLETELRRLDLSPILRKGQPATVKAAVERAAAARRTSAKGGRRPSTTPGSDAPTSPPRRSRPP